MASVVLPVSASPYTRVTLATAKPPLRDSSIALHPVGIFCMHGTSRDINCQSIICFASTCSDCLDCRMRARIAVMTVSGRAYYIVVSELKRRGIPFLSLNPNESVPVGIKVVITTESERRLIDHETVLTYGPRVEPSVLVNEALRVVHGKEAFEKVVIGVDPGEVFGLAVLAGGRVVETDNCYSVSEVVGRIESIVGQLDSSVAMISVKIGNGVPKYESRLIHALDKSLPVQVMLESVREDGTDACVNEAKHRRGLRDIVSAIQIAGRNGRTYQRRAKDESYCR
jgi:hypothetical protein